jgi:hypothetical protein
MKKHFSKNLVASFLQPATFMMEPLHPTSAQFIFSISLAESLTSQNTILVNQVHLDSQKLLTRQHNLTQFIEIYCTLAESDWNKCMSALDAVVLSTCAGLFQNSIVKEELPTDITCITRIQLFYYSYVRANNSGIMSDPHV